MKVYLLISVDVQMSKTDPAEDSVPFDWLLVL